MSLKCTKENQGEIDLVRDSARLELASVGVIGSRMYVYSVLKLLCYSDYSAVTPC